jgi:hypothetical protein
MPRIRNPEAMNHSEILQNLHDPTLILAPLRVSAFPEREPVA